jgi:hypothetical protein
VVSLHREVAKRGCHGPPVLVDGLAVLGAQRIGTVAVRSRGRVGGGENCSRGHRQGLFIGARVQAGAEQQPNRNPQ